MKIKELERNFRLLSGRKRLEILKYLSDNKTHSVGDIASYIQLSLKSTSKHVLLLAQGDLLERKRVGFEVLYRSSEDFPAYFKPILNIIRTAK